MSTHYYYRFHMKENNIMGLRATMAIAYEKKDSEVRYNFSKTQHVILDMKL